MDCLAGRKLADIVANLNEGVEAVSPCRRLFLNQPRLEPILRDRAREAGATILQGVQLIDVRQDSSGVSVTVEDADGGNAHELRGRYLIAADGGHSRVRQSLGIDYEGRGAFSNSVTIYFTADLSPWLGDKAWSLIYVNNPLFRGFFRMNRSAQAGFLAINTLGDPQQRLSRPPRMRPRTSARAGSSNLCARAWEIRNLAVRIDGYTRWRATANVAKKFQDRRIFIAGDAAHLMPPNGGFGGNTGIHDAHNLAWKLALVLQGHARANLLDSYATERKPVARFTVEQAFARYVARTAPWLQASQRPEPLVDDLTSSSATSTTARSGGHADPRTTRGVPGSRAPHLWLARAGRRLSTIDLTGHYLLLAGDRGRRLGGGCQGGE